MLSNLSLKYRIAIIIFILEAVMMTVVLQLTLGQSFESSSQQINNNERAILELVSGISKSALITEEYAELQPYIEHLLSNTEVTRVLLADAYKIIVASTSPSDIGQQIPERNKRADYSWQVREITNAAGLMGIVAIEFSNKAIITAHADARDFGIGIALVGMLIIASVGILVGILLTRRLAIITDTAQRLATGDFSARTNIHARDELGKLASSFDHMVQGLLESKYELGQTLATLQEREQDLVTTLNSIGDAVIATDAKGHVTRMNPVAEQLTGWSLREAQGQPLKTIFPILNASTRESIENPVDEVIASGDIVYLSNHTTLIARDGTEYQIADSAAPIRDSEKILGMILVFNDVTEQYQLRQTAAKSQRDLQAIMDNTPAVIYVKDTEGHFIFINHQFEKLFHIQRKDIIGKTLHDIFPKDIADQMQRNDKAVLAAGHAIESEEDVPQEDGLHTYVSVKFPLFNEENSIYAVCGISTDITERRQQEEQLRRSQKMDALGKLTGGIAHDYNNLLGIILGYAGLLDDHLSHEPRLEKYARDIQHAAERGTELTRKLLAFTRHKAPDASVLDINKLLQDQRLMLEKILTVRIKLVFDLANDLWPVWLDSGDLEDAVINMSINAMHAIDGNGQLTLRTHNEQLSATDAQMLRIDAGDYVLLSITDTGSGMDKTTKEKIFDPFFSTKGERGTGLGLSQVYGFVERSGGTIKVYSEPGHGSRFALYFPRNRKSDIDTQAAISLGKQNFRGSETLLVVDDETALAELAQDILTAQGYRVLTANDGEQALSVLAKETVDLIISDVIMPTMGGYQLASRVEQDYPHIKIQMVSGFTDDRSEQMTNDALHQKLLYKPYTSNTLLAQVRSLLDKDKAQLKEQARQPHHPGDG